MTQGLLTDFIDYLASKVPDFKGLPEELYDPRYNKGTKNIYDFVKKRLFKSEEKPVGTKKASAKKKGAASKPAADRSDDKQDKADPPIVKVEALDEVGIGGEKNMAYRKDIHSEA